MYLYIQLYVLGIMSEFYLFVADIGMFDRQVSDAAAWPRS